MKLPLMLVALGLVSFFPETAVDFAVRLFIPTAPIVHATSWLARYEVVGVLLMASGAALVWKRFGRAPEKKLL